MFKGTQSIENLNEYSSETFTDRGYTSDSELYQQPSQPLINASSLSSLNTLDTVNSNDDALKRTNTSQNPVNQYKIDLDDEGLGLHDKKAFAKCCETLTFLIRDMAHITLQNFESCIHCLRTFVEACVLGGTLLNA